MKALMKKLKNQWILIWLIVVALGATALVSYGAYTGLKSVKRVVTTKPSPGDLFSSNCMRTSPTNKRISGTEYTVTVCNYEQKNHLVPNPSDVNYTLTATIMVLNGSEYKTMSQLASILPQQEYAELEALITGRTYSIAKVYDDVNGSIDSPVELSFDSSNYTRTFSGETLKKDISSTDKYKVTFDSAELNDQIPDFYVHLEAVATGYTSLECHLGAAMSTEEASAWQGEFVEDYINYDYDFYNYIITGSGKGTVDISWDPQWFEINPFFTNALSGNTVTTPAPINNPGFLDDGWKKITLTVDSVNDKNRYELQLYKAKRDVTYKNVNLDLKIKVSFTPTE